MYTIMRNRSHANIDFMFLEKDFLLPEEDTLHVVRGIAVSRPNLLLGVGEADLERFFADWRGLVASGSNWRQFVDRYGVRRTDPEFWRTLRLLRRRVLESSTPPSRACSTCRGTGTTEP